MYYTEALAGAYSFEQLQAKTHCSYIASKRAGSQSRIIELQGYMVHNLTLD